jgi:proton-coupled amino acid transporter
MGVLLGYPIQFFIAIQIMFPSIKNKIALANDHPFIGELFFRSAMVLVTFAVANLIPKLDLLLSLIGAVCSTILALVLPPLIEFIIMPCDNNVSWWWLTLKNSIILIIAILGFLTGNRVKTLWFVVISIDFNRWIREYIGDNS